MANYGLSTIDKKYGTGSFYTPYASTTAKSLLITPSTGDFGIADNQDFVISVWIKYGDLRVSTPNARYPIIQYGGLGGRYWSLGYTVLTVGTNIPFAYFQYGSTVIRTTFDGTNRASISPDGWSNWLIQRSNGVITFTFTNKQGVPNVTTANFSSAIAHNQTAGTGMYVGATNPVIVNGDNGAYVDELFFARGTSTIASRNPTTGAIYDGRLATTAFLYQFDGNYYDDETGVQQASAALVSTCTTSTAAVASKRASSALTSRFTVAASGVGPVSAQAAITARATVSASISRTRPASAALTTTSTASIAVTKLKSTSVNLTAFNSVVSAGIETFRTSRPYTLYMISGSAGNTQTVASTNNISTSRFKYGTGSLTVPGFIGGVGGSYAIVNPGSTTSNFAIGANTDFYISFWTLTTTTITSPGVGVYIPIFQVAGLQLGYFSNGIDPFFRSVRGDFTPMISTANIPANTWHQWEAFRTGDTFVFRFNGAVVGNRTYTGATSSNTSQNSEIDIGAFGASRSFNFDEVFFARGVSDVVNTKPSGEIGDGSLATTQVLYHFNGDAIDDITGIQAGQASLTSASALAANASEISRGSAAITARATVSATATRIKTGAAGLVVRATITATAGVIKRTSGAITARATVAATGIRVRFAQVQLATAAATVPNAIKTARTGSNLTAFVTTLTVSARRLASTASMFADTAVTADAMVVRTVESNLQNTVILAANAVRTVRVSANLTTNSSSSLQVTAFKRISANLTSSSTQSTRADRFARFAAGLTTSATLVARPVQEVKSSMITRASLAATIGVRRGTAQANLTTQVLWSYIYDKTKPLARDVDLWVVPADIRIYAIPPSLASWIIPEDQRTYIIEQDVREYKIAPQGTEFTIEE